MKILFLGDIVARPGRDAVKKILPELKDQYKPDLIIANGENITHGRGMSEENIEDLVKAGINFFTSGNHIYAHPTILPKLDDKKFPVIRPANFPPGNPGRGYHLYETADMKTILIVNLMGRVFMRHNYDCPFRTLETIINEHRGVNLSAIIVDMHGEATSEKIAFARYFDGKVTAILGTHTHVPTKDAEVLPEGTAYITDIGMVGAKDSVIGAEKEPIIKSFLTQMPFKYEIPKSGPVIFSAVFIQTDDSSMRAVEIEHIMREIEI